VKEASDNKKAGSDGKEMGEVGIRREAVGYEHGGNNGEEV